MKRSWFWRALAILGLALAAAYVWENRWFYTVYSYPYKIAEWDKTGRVLRDLEEAYDDQIVPGAMMKVNRITGREYAFSKSAGWVRIRVPMSRSKIEKLMPEIKK